MCFRPAGVARVMQCPECGAFNKPGNVVCQKCGKDFSEEIAAAEAAAAETMVAPAIPGNAPTAPGNAPRPGNAPGNAPRPGNAPGPGGLRSPSAPPRPPSAPPPKASGPKAPSKPD
ncbi:MAG: hypothetical protein LBL86_12525 [Coriobacteriales bacterium]|jgi:hypothetical protein|nr:hypothetical protein [Coriobacteriales bacterium]